VILLFLNVMLADPSQFSYTKESLDALETSLSPGCLALYEELARGNLSDSLKLYCWNTSLSQCLYWPLHAFEVSLRNAMADRMADAYGNDWYEKIPEFSKRRGTTDNTEAEHVEKAKRKLDEDGLLYGHDNIVAAISMGFWLGLLKDEYREKLWEPLFSNIFPMIDREETFRKVNQIKRLRNSVAHHEPILVFLPKRHKRELFKDYKLILKMTRWICPVTARWVEHHSCADFFTTWNFCAGMLGMPRLATKSDGNEAHSSSWQLS
jgi:hypothetical protein